MIQIDGGGGGVVVVVVDDVVIHRVVVVVVDVYRFDPHPHSRGNASGFAGAGHWTRLLDHTHAWPSPVTSSLHHTRLKTQNIFSVLIFLTGMNVNWILSSYAGSGETNISIKRETLCCLVSPIMCYQSSFWYN